MNAWNIHNPYRRRGFSLIELLVVIAIIALLVGIVLPSLNKAKVLAQRARCATNLRAVSVGLRMYLNESDDVMPYAAAMPSLQLNDEPAIAEVLAKYLGSPEVLLCPGDPGEKFYKAEGSSYEYRTMLGGRKVGEDFLTRRWGEDRSPVMMDYDSFHGRPGTFGSRNYLFVDGHVGDLADADDLAEYEKEHPPP